MADNETNLKKETANNTAYANDLIGFFENFLKSGVVVKEEEIVPGFKVKLKVLNTEELLLAETVLSSSNPNIPYDVMQKVRSASILAQSIISINGLLIEREDMTKEDNFNRRNNLYRQILKMPALIIQKTYEFYIKAVKEQNSYYENSAEAHKKIENF